jgi:hypothetical protein
MSAPVDVLAVMDQAAATLGWDGTEIRANGDEEGAERYFKQADAIREARAAVAELIEADHELDAARQALWESGGLDGVERAAALNREIDAKERRAAALANASGAP